VLTDFLALRLFFFNIRRQHGRPILYFKLHVDGRKFHYRRPQVMHRWAGVTLCYEAGCGYASCDHRVNRLEIFAMLVDDACLQQSLEANRTLSSFIKYITRDYSSTTGSLYCLLV